MPTNLRCPDCGHAQRQHSRLLSHCTTPGCTCSTYPTGAVEIETAEEKTA